MTNPSELKWEEECHYIHTLQYFNELLRTHGAKQVLEDLRNLDLTTYENFVTMVVRTQATDKKVSALLTAPYANKD